MLPLVALHGFGGNASQFDALAIGKRELIAPVLYGHGRAAAERPTSFQAEVERILAWLRQRGVMQAHLLGYSLGARVGLGLLLAAPERFTSATLIGGHPGLEDAAARRARAEQDDALAARLEQRGASAFFADWERQPLFTSQQRLPQEVLARQRAVRTSHEPRALAHALRVLSLGRMPVMAERACSLRLPIHLVAGELDDKFGTLLEPFAKRLARGRFSRVPRAGHNPILETPEQVSDLLQAALGS